ncbi:MAG TPA: TolC family protein [Myxococcaceae bacterium]|jgi:outer membrane protein
MIGTMGTGMLLAVAALAAEPMPQVLTLDQALKTAAERQPQLRQAAAATAASQARADQSRAALLPQLRLSAGYDRGTNNRAGVPPYSFASSDAWNAAVSANQLVWDFGQTWNRWQAAGAQAEAQASNEQSSRLQAAFNVRSAFFTAHGDKALVEVARETLGNQERHLQQIQGFVRVGTRPEIDLAQARTDLANARLLLVNAENAYDLARAQLNQAMGVEGSLEYDVADNQAPVVEGEDGTTDELLKQALSVRPEVAALDQQVRAQELTVSAVSGGYWPSLGVGATVSEGGPRLDGLAWNWSLGPTLSWSFFEGGRTSAAVRESRAQLDSLHAQVDDLRQSVRLDVEQARLAIRASKAALAAAADAATNARERLKLAEGRYQAGVGNAIELGDAQVALTSALAQKVQADQRLASSRAQLLRALGRP